MRTVSHEKRQLLLDQIYAWKSTQDYAQGVKLYQQLIGDTATYWVLLTGATQFNRQKLADALEEVELLLAADQAEASSTEPGDVKEWRSYTKQLMNRRAALKAQFILLKTQQERKDQAFAILDISEELDDVFGKIELFEKQGVIYQPLAEQVEKPLRRYLNVRSYISRTQGKLSAAILPDEISKLKVKLDALHVELTALELTQEVKEYLKR